MKFGGGLLLGLFVVWNGAFADGLSSSFSHCSLHFDSVDTEMTQGRVLKHDPAAFITARVFQILKWTIEESGQVYGFSGESHFPEMTVSNFGFDGHTTVLDYQISTKMGNHWQAAHGVYAFLTVSENRSGARSYGRSFNPDFGRLYHWLRQTPYERSAEDVSFIFKVRSLMALKRFENVRIMMPNLAEKSEPQIFSPLPIRNEMTKGYAAPRYRFLQFWRPDEDYWGPLFGPKSVADRLRWQLAYAKSVGAVDAHADLPADYLGRAEAVLARKSQAEREVVSYWIEPETLELGVAYEWGAPETPSVQIELYKL